MRHTPISGIAAAEAVEEPRETAATTTALVLAYVRLHGGDRAVDTLLARAGVAFSAAELEDPARWFSYRTRIRLFEAATEVLADPGTAFRIGATALEHSVPSIVLLVRALGSPRQVFRHLPSAVTKFSTTSTMEMLDCGPGHAVIRYRLHPGYRHSRLDCQYAQGLISTVPALFGLPPARIEHPACESDGHAACLYRVTWQRRPRLSALGRLSRDHEVDALRGQLRTLQSAASDLVGSEDLTETLARITERAASAVVAPAYLLAVRRPDDGGLLLHSAGLDAATAEASAAELLAGGDLGPHAVVVDVATARASYGRLAALYGPRQRGMADEAELLSAYAAHAAAALELVLALEASRRDEARSRDLLLLAHRLSTTEDEQQVADVVVTAIPAVLGVSKASFLRWDAGDGVLRCLATSGLSPAERAVLLAAELRPSQVPEFARMLTRYEPTVLHAATASPALRELLAVVGSHDVVAVPLLSGGALLGVITADRGAEPSAGWPDQEAVARLRGVADQAASALQNARLLMQVRHQAQHDGLTGLPDRMRFSEELEQQLVGSREEVAVLFCDLDGFKQVNDRLGHAAGDELLRQVAARLRASVREGDLVARLSGDEFALLLRGPGAARASREVADRVIEELSAPFRLEGRQVRISTSVGVAVHGGEEDGDALLRRADAAMYLAKQRGRSQVAHADALPCPAATSRSTATELRDGLRDGQLELHYQPIVRIPQDPGDAGLLLVEGQEALARWRHPERGLLAPGAFLPWAEEAGCLPELDLWALRTAVAAAATWTTQPGLSRVAVNLSAPTLLDRRLLPTVRAALATGDVEPERLTLEVVESRSLFDLPGVVEQLTALRQLGVRIALDDFGTGYSTLSWLQRLPIDRIKLDRSFVSGLGQADAARSLVAGVVALARTLEIEVVAEGVETPGQLEALRSVGCGLGQGYLFGRPTPVPVHGLIGALAA